MYVLSDTAMIAKVAPSITLETSTWVTAQAMPATTTQTPKPLSEFIALLDSFPRGYAGHVRLHDGRHKPISPHSGVHQLWNQQGLDEHPLPAEIPSPE